jgi:hypothetical protein
MKRSLYEICFALIVIVIIVVLSIILFKSCSDKQSLKQSNSALFLQYQKADLLVKLYKTKTGMSAASVKIVQATKSDIKTGMHNEVSQLESASVNPNEITTIGTINAKINVDSLKWSYQTEIDSLKQITRCAAFADTYIKAVICVKSDSIKFFNFNAFVPIIWASSDVRKKLWFITLPKWLFGIKERRFTITTTSKYIELTGAEYVEKK